MRRLLLTTLVLAGLAYPEVAGAGCWATVTLAPPPAGNGGRRRVDGEDHRPPAPTQPAARRGPRPTDPHDLERRNRRARTFTAHPTQRPGVYEAAVVFPSEGSWRYEVYDDFTSWNGEAAPCARSHELASAQIGADPPTSRGATPSGGGGSGMPLWPVLGRAMAVLGGLAAAAGLVLRRCGERVFG